MDGEGDGGLGEGADTLPASLEALRVSAEKLDKEAKNGSDASPSSGCTLSIADHVARMDDPDDAIQVVAVTELRKLLSKKSNTIIILSSKLCIYQILINFIQPEDRPINEVILSGAVPRLVELLSRDDCPKLQLEAAWALTKITGGTTDHVKTVVDANAVPPLVRLIGSKDEDVCAESIWTLGNIARDCVRYRDMLLCSGVMSVLVEKGMVNNHRTVYLY
jgi:hypothetical protein